MPAGIQSAARCEDQHPAQQHELGVDAPMAIHRTSNTAPLVAEGPRVRSVLAEWTMSPRAKLIISHIAAKIVELELTPVASTARQAGRRLLAETRELGGGVAVDDVTTPEEAVKDPRLSADLDGGNLPMISGHDPDMRMRTAQHQCERMALAQGGAHIGLHTGRQTRATVQHVKGHRNRNNFQAVNSTALRLRMM